MVGILQLHGVRVGEVPEPRPVVQAHEHAGRHEKRIRQLDKRESPQVACVDEVGADAEQPEPEG